MSDFRKKLIQTGTKSVGVLGAWAIMASVAFAQFDPSDVKSLPVTSMPLSDMIRLVVNFALALVGIIAVLYLIFGGITYVTAGGDSEKAGKGRQTITNAIIGIVIILASLAIYNGVISGVKSGAVK